jgi:hypothetical protein
MAKLSTPYHQCATAYVDNNGVPTGHHCPYAAYRKSTDGRWLCRSCNRRARARAARA